MPRRIIIALVAVLAFGLAGCNTFAGFGQDIQGAGSAIEDAANDWR